MYTYEDDRPRILGKYRQPPEMKTGTNDVETLLICKIDRELREKLKQDKHLINFKHGQS